MSNPTELFLQTRLEALLERSWIAEDEIQEYEVAEIEEYLKQGGTIHRSMNCECAKCFDFAEMMMDVEYSN